MRSIDTMLKEVKELRTDEARHGWVISLSDDERIVLINQCLLPMLKLVHKFWDEALWPELRDVAHYALTISKPWGEKLWHDIYALTGTDDAAL